MRVGEDSAPNSEFLNFQFLLNACEDIAAGNSRGRDDLRNWKSSYAFHHVRHVCVCCLRRAVVLLLFFLLVLLRQRQAFDDTFFVTFCSIWKH